jgi:hypothetical protein
LACAAGLGVSVGAASSCASATSFVPSIGLAHLLSHSFAKASLFCCVGVLLHGALSQDMREFGAWAASSWRAAASASSSSCASAASCGSSLRSGVGAAASRGAASARSLGSCACRVGAARCARASVFGPSRALGAECVGVKGAAAVSPSCVFGVGGSLGVSGPSRALGSLGYSGRAVRAVGGAHVGLALARHLSSASACGLLGRVGAGLAWSCVGAQRVRHSVAFAWRLLWARVHGGSLDSLARCGRRVLGVLCGLLRVVRCVGAGSACLPGSLLPSSASAAPCCSRGSVRDGRFGRIARSCSVFSGCRLRGALGIVGAARVLFVRLVFGRRVSSRAALAASYGLGALCASGSSRGLGDLATRRTVGLMGGSCAIGHLVRFGSQALFGAGLAGALLALGLMAGWLLGVFARSARVSSCVSGASGSGR